MCLGLALREVNMIHAYIITMLEMDDMLLTSPSRTGIIRMKDLLKSEYDMKDLGKAKKILGMVINNDRSTHKLTITQKSYLDKVITKFGMKKAKSMHIPLATHMNLSTEHVPKTNDEIN